MANVPSQKKYIQQPSVTTRNPVSESLLQTLSGSVNYCLDKSDFYANKTLKYVDFIASGTWTVPQDVSMVIIEAIGGGGGGGGGGGAGCIKNITTISVTPSAVIPITIGAAGAAGSYATNGGAGGNTLFDSTIVAKGAGGGGGGGGQQIGAAGDLGHTYGGNGTNPSVSNPSYGQGSGLFSGGASFGSAFFGTSGGGGGASSYGDGGNGANSGFSTAQSGHGYGAGGGGGAVSASPWDQGGSGVSGFMRITYLSGY